MQNSTPNTPADPIEANLTPPDPAFIAEQAFRLERSWLATASRASVEIRGLASYLGQQMSISKTKSWRNEMLAILASLKHNSLDGLDTQKAFGAKDDVAHERGQATVAKLYNEATKSLLSRESPVSAAIAFATPAHAFVTECIEVSRGLDHLLGLEREKSSDRSMPQHAKSTQGLTSNPAMERPKESGQSQSRQ